MPLEPNQARASVREAVWELTKRSLGDDECIVSTGLIDSLSVIRLISLLDRKLQIRIPTERVQPEDFDSVEVILETLQRLEL
jgi:acyl carrier protein